MSSNEANHGQRTTWQGGILRKSVNGVATIAPAMIFRGKVLSTTAVTIGGLIATSFLVQNANAQCISGHADVNCSNTQISTNVLSKTLPYSSTGLNYNFSLASNFSIATSGNLNGNDNSKVPKGALPMEKTSTGSDAFAIDAEGTTFTSVTKDVKSNYAVGNNTSVTNCASGIAGVYTCTGTISTSEIMIVSGTTNIVATLNDSATVNVSAGIAFSMEGENAVTFTQFASGRTVNATYDATGVISAVTTGSGSVSVTLTGTANLQRSGTAVRVSSTGSGAVSITAVQVNANNSSAIAIEARGSGSSVTVSTTGTVSGGKRGISAFNHRSGAGTVTVSAGGTVTGSGETAIYAWNKGTGGVSVTASAVSAGNDGIDVVNLSGGSIVITASGNVLTRNVIGAGAGISAENDSQGNGITVTAQGVSKVEGGYGIFVYNHGTGNVSVTSDGEIEGTQEQGLYVINNGGKTDVSVRNVEGITFGVDIGHYGSNTATIAIVTGGSISANEVGMRVMAEGAGDVKVTASGAITGTTGDGIYAFQSGNADISINVSSVTGGTDGIQVVKTGNGTVNVGATGAVIATGSAGEDGVYVGHSGNGNTTITVSAVSASEDGVDVKKTGNGNVSVVATGIITTAANSTEDGIYVGTNGSGNISVTANTVSGDTDGIDLRNFGGGTVTAIANGAVTANGSGDLDAGIFLYNDASGGTISVSIGSSGSLSGHNGVVFEDKGRGRVTLNATGNVTGVRSDGIHIDKTSTGSVLLNVGLVSGKKRGIFIDHTGTGAITVTATKLVSSTATSESHSGIEISNSGANIGLVLTSVTGTKHGVEVKTVGTGDISIVTSGAITGQTDGIRAYVEGRGNISLTVSGNITSGSEGFGIKTKAVNGTTTIVFNGGDIGGRKALKILTGSSNITVNNDAEFIGDVNLGAGVDLLTINSSKFNPSIWLDGGEDSPTDRSVDVLTFSSGTNRAVGAQLRNWERIIVANGATLRFNTTNTVIGEEFRILGTLSVQDGATDDRLIVTGNLTTPGNNITGMIAVDVNFATKDADTITVQGNMTGKKQLVVRDVTPSNNSTRSEDPITILNVVGTTSAEAMTLSGNRVHSGGYLYTLSFDNNTRSFRLIGVPGVTSCSGTTTSGSFNCSGTINSVENIVARGNENLTANLASDATVSVSADAAIVMSGRASVTFTQAANGGTMTASGTASGVIQASTTGSGAVSIRLTGTATLTGAGTAVKASSTGTGSVTITAASVVAGNSAGIALEAEGNGGPVIVNISTASGGRNGILAKNSGANGSVTVSATGTTNGGTTGIDARTSSGNITVNAVAVTGGVVAKNAGGTGNVNVTTTGDVTGSRSVALDVENLGSGLIAIRATGAVTASAAAGVDVNAGSINVNAGSQVSSVSISANNVSGVRHAVRSINRGSGATTIMLNGVIRSQSSSAVHAHNAGSGTLNITLGGAVTGGSLGATVETLSDGGTTNITLNSGAVITGTIAIRNDEGASNLTVNAGATISGQVRLGAGVDTLTFAESSFGDSILDGGNDSGNTQPVDVLTFNSGAISTSRTDERWLNWEKIVIGSGATVTFSGDTHHIDATDIELKGTASIQNGSATNTLTFRSNLIGGGTIKLDANFYTGSADLINVLNDVSGTTKLDIRDISTGTGGEDDEAILIVDVHGTATASSFELVRNAESSGAYDYELIFNRTARSFSVTRKQSASSVMLVAAPITLLDGFARATTLYERRSVDSNQPFWSRVISKSNGYGTAREGSAVYESSNTGFQIGYEIATTANNFGSLVYGATIQYNSIEVDVTAFNVPGTYSAQGFGIGGTATLYLEDGTFVDTQLQLNQISADFDVGNDIGTLLSGHESNAMLLSAEVGRRHQISKEYTLLYTGQFSWGNVDGGNATTTNAQSVNFDGDSSLTLRGGVRIAYLSGTNQFYGLANLYIDSMDSWDIVYENETYSDTKGSVFAELGFGGEVEISPNAAWFGQAAFKTSLKSGVEKRDSTSLSTGIRWSW